jgi:putative transposase
MPWKETDLMDERTAFVLRAIRGRESLGKLCAEFGITRRTGYKWKSRFLSEGLAGLSDQSRRPTLSPRGIREDLVCRIVHLKLCHRWWGARKLRAVMERTVPPAELPSESSFKRILERAGLVTRRPRLRAASGTRLKTPVRAERPNHVWTIDFKGWWYTRNHDRFEPLTIRDDFSRYLLCTQAMENAQTETVRTLMMRVFDRYGLPEVIRSDNGSPFAAQHSPLGLSRLSAWWLTLGINLDRIRPGCPSENGGHERMHGDLAREVEGDAEVDPATQQAVLDVWRTAFNEERPHEALGMRVPGELYQPSPRAFDPMTVELSYPSTHLVRKVKKTGAISVRGVRVRISEALGGFEVGLEPVSESRLAVWFCRLCLGEIDLVNEKFQGITSDGDRESEELLEYSTKRDDLRVEGARDNASDAILEGQNLGPRVQ